MQRSILVFSLWVAAALVFSGGQVQAAEFTYAGSHFDIGGKFFPGGGPADTQAYVVVPWRTSSTANIYATSSEPGEQYYGRDGYNLFSTVADYPDANDSGGLNAAWDSATHALLFPDMEDMPDYVSDSLVLSSSRGGGWGYSLIDDPELTQGIRDWEWGESQSPPSTSQPPYVKIGILSGWDRFGHDPASTDPEAQPAGRWGFEVGADPPERIRLGVMSGGYDGATSQFAPNEVFFGQVSTLGFWDESQLISTGEIERNRFVDIHFFDIVGAQEGDLFAVGTKGITAVAAISGITFDILPDPVGLAGDYNGDDIVNIADYVVWRNTLGASVTPGEGADGDESGTIDAGDYTFWKDRFGDTLMSSAAAVQVPEPSSLVIVAAAGLILAIGRGRLKLA